MALFGGKKGGGGDQASGGNGDGGAPHEYSPDKAAKWFERAKTVHETTNYEYAMSCWLSGLRFQPTSMPALTGLFESAAALAASGSKGPGKEIRKEFGGGKADIDKYLAALLEAAANQQDGGAWVKATMTAGAMGLVESVRWLGERAMVAAAQEKRPRKDHFVQLSGVLAKFGVYDRAVQAGEMAVRIDPSDSRLAAEVRNMAAQQTMSKGGFEQTAGKEGGFRANIRDSEKQKRLAMQDQIVKTAGTHDQLIAMARAEHEARPTDKPTIAKYAKALLDRGTPEDEETAHALLIQAYQQTQEYRFHQGAGEIRIKQARRRIAHLAAEAQKAGNQGPTQDALEQARKELLDHEIEEYQGRVKAYPTDLPTKFELGKRLFEAGRYEESIALFQEAKAEIKNRARVMLYLGMAFEKIDFHDGAIETFRGALDGSGPSDAELALELRYGLMLALAGRAKENNELASAEEAYKLASAIAIQQFSYRDVRARQVELKQMIAAMKG